LNNAQNNELVCSRKTDLLMSNVNITSVKLRPIEERDNPVIASVIRQTLKEFGANRPGTVYYDEATDHLFESFRDTKRSMYCIAEKEGTIVGGGGIFPSAGLPDDTCELVKMYLLPEARGIGLGKLLIQNALDFATAAGYKQVYLETMPELRQALSAYAKFGFEYIDHPMGNTGHFGCDLWMLKQL
jgi:putative acetyltransferase